jgi:tRNA-uridine 2-sulfurtransferase
VRSTKAPVAGFLHVDAGEARVAFASCEDGVSPGQACVLYDSDRNDARVLGGGYIAETESAIAAGHHPQDASLAAADG